MEEIEKSNALGFEKKLWSAADKMRSNMDAAEYKHVVLGDDKLRMIALELVNMIRNSVKIDWTVRESVQAELRLRVKKILKKYGYPPSGQEHATELVLTQAKKVAEDWADK